ncbi:hypothetical protein I540_5350 [Mycobacteroides abscessus subsp. bolletii 1513]|uniref:Uncharacterized protein n=1 Tax=Mycobacteroides abscessus subsp. bolletii 1513 TaxID=1299321 RepID=X8DIC7_9MYCO|nr:hypothetical protein I540_5350 [Mycobacteroides abscessus subsp. bolletii 1513]
MLAWHPSGVGVAGVTVAAAGAAALATGAGAAGAAGAGRESGDWLGRGNRCQGAQREPAS